MFIYKLKNIVFINILIIQKNNFKFILIYKLLNLINLFVPHKIL